MRWRTGYIVGAAPPWLYRSGTTVVVVAATALYTAPGGGPLGSVRTSRRGLTSEDVRDACQAPNRYRRAAWHVHPEYGRRLIVFGSNRDGKLIKVILQPVDQHDGTWRLRTAVIASRGEGG